MLFDNTYFKGLISEWYVRLFLRLCGYKILESRYSFGKNKNRSEIDIIAKKHNIIIFCEVKSRQNLELGINALSNNQIQRLRLACETYIINKGWLGDARIDLFVVTGFKIYWLKQFC